MEYIIYCDESSARGIKYSDFFGGCIIEAGKIHAIEDALNRKKDELNLHGEIKWTKVTEPYLEKYCTMISTFFSFVRNGDVKVRIMFRKTANQYKQADMPVKDERYFKLYYEFIKHGFGFSTDRSITGDYYAHILLDELPDHSPSADAFKDYLCRLPKVLSWANTGLKVRKRDVGEVCSHDHVVLQCVDIILGAMYFRLNNLHKVKEPGQRIRGKRTRAKEKLYEHILEEIQTIHSGFNIGVSTGSRGYENPHWESPYEHWEFKPY